MLIASRATWGRLAATVVFLSRRRTPLASAAFAVAGNKTRMLMSAASMMNSSPYLTFHHLKEPVASTQDEARRLLRERNNVDEASDNKCLAVLADQQIQGRGTKGRNWEGGDRTGNLYLTVCVPMDRVPVVLTLLPLQVGVLVAQRVTRLLQACQTKTSNHKNVTQATVKWPNDVLVDDMKISGTLIENEILNGTSWLLVGVGVNVAFAPSLSKSPGMQVRGSTCVQDFCPGNILPQDTAAVLGLDLANSLVEWVVDREMTRSVKELMVIQDWKSFAEFGREYRMRGEVQDENAGTHKGETVVSVDIQYDGQLLVRGENGRERLLIADYMF